jgi:hypothetical protein
MTMTQEIVTSLILSIIKILIIKDHKLNNAFLHFYFGLEITVNRSGASTRTEQGLESNSQRGPARTPKKNKKSRECLAFDGAGLENRADRRKSESSFCREKRGRPSERQISRRKSEPNQSARAENRRQNAVRAGWKFSSGTKKPLQTGRASVPTGDENLLEPRQRLSKPGNPRARDRARKSIRTQHEKCKKWIRHITRLKNDFSFQSK